MTFLGWNIGLNSCNTKDLYGNFIFCLNAYHQFIYVQGRYCDSAKDVLLIALLHKLFCLSCNLLKGSISKENTNSSCFDISPRPLKQWQAYLEISFNIVLGSSFCIFGDPFRRFHGKHGDLSSVISNFFCSWKIWNGDKIQEGRHVFFWITTTFSYYC